MASQGFEPYKKLFLPVIRGMHILMGDRSEFILHDLSDPEHSMVAIEGNVTGRQPGASVTNIVIEAIKKDGDDAPDMIGYSSISKEGKPLKSATVFIRDTQGHIVGCVCCNLDLTDFMVAQNLLESLSACNHQPSGNGRNKEVFAQDIREVMEEIIQNEIASACHPAPMMSRSEKISLIRELEAKCVFEVKGSVEFTARSLGVSSYTVYGYLKEIRNEKQE